MNLPIYCSISRQFAPGRRPPDYLAQEANLLHEKVRALRKKIIGIKEQPIALRAAFSNLKRTLEDRSGGAHQMRWPWCGCCAARCCGFTLVEILIAIAIFSTLAGIGIPLYSDLTEKARVAKAVWDIRALAGEIAIFEVTNGRLPDSLEEIGQGTLRDSWGNGYEYLNFSTLDNRGKGQMRKDRFLVPLNSTYDLYSKGKDGRSQPPLTARDSQDDVVRANDGGYVGLASAY